MKFAVLPVALSQLLAAISQGHFDSAMNYALIFAGFSALIGVATPLVQYIGMRGENKIYRQETANYFGQLLNADVEYFNSNLSGYLTTATRQYIDSGLQIMRALRDNYSQTVMALVLPVMVIAVTNWVLGIIVFVLSATQLIYLIWSSYAMEPFRLRARELYKRNSGIMADAISNILAVKATAREKDVIENVANNAREESEAFRLRYTVRAKLTAGREATTVIAYIIILFALVMMAGSSSISLQGAILVATYITPILTAIYTLSLQLDEHDDLVDKLIPGFDLLESKRAIEEPTKPKKFVRVQGEIDFRDVTFSYNKESTKVFDELSFHIPVGQKVGVVGLSGAGKSTLTKLLLRFDDVDGGVVSIDGIDVRDVRQSDLRRHIAYVPQEPLLFHASIRENVLFSRPEADKKAIEYALRVSHAKQFIDELPEGSDSIVGERGVKLSGGQKQRVAIARAVLQSAPIIVLDEATSALDSESEQIIKSSFKDVLKGKTAIVVAHRLSTLSDMDRILVVDKGRIVEDGSHDDLLVLGGVYAKLWRRQQRVVEPI
jgi:ATP-binding cassette subfamily B protein